MTCPLLRMGGHNNYYTFITARRSYDSAVLGVVILSVCQSVRLSVRPSVIRVLCD